MRFSLRALLLWTVVIAVYLGLAFGLPPIFGGPLLLMMTLWLPVVIVCGIIYGREMRRAFWIGCATGGFVPLLVGLYFAYSIGISLVLIDLSSDIDFDEFGAYTSAFAVLHGFVYLSGAVAVVARAVMLRSARRSAPAQTPVTTSVLHRRIVVEDGQLD